MADWQRDGPRLAAMWLSADTTDAMCARFGITKHNLSIVGRRLGLPPRHKDGTVKTPGLAQMEARLARLMALDVPPALIASAFCVPLGDVRAAMARLKAAAPRPPRLAVVAEAMPAPLRLDDPGPGPARWTPARDARLRDVKPPLRYARVAELSAEWGIPMRDVQARWHRLRAGAYAITQEARP